MSEQIFETKFTNYQKFEGNRVPLIKFVFKINSDLHEWICMNQWDETDLYDKHFHKNNS